MVYYSTSQQHTSIYLPLLVEAITVLGEPVVEELNGVLQLVLYIKEKNAILFTYPLEGSFTSTVLVVSFSDRYTLTIDSADIKSISAGKSVHFTKSVTQWFTKDGVLVEGLFSKDVEGLIKEYATEEPKKKKCLIDICS